MPGTGGGGITSTMRVRVAHQPALQVGQDAVAGQALTRALLEGLQAGEDDAGVRRVGEGGAVEADEGDGVARRPASP